MVSSDRAPVSVVAVFEECFVDTVTHCSRMILSSL